MDRDLTIRWTNRLLQDKVQKVIGTYLFQSDTGYQISTHETLKYQINKIRLNSSIPGIRKNDN